MRVRISLIKSPIGSLPVQRKTLKALGLKKVGSSVEHEATSVINGMIRTIAHLVKVEEI